MVAFSVLEQLELYRYKATELYEQPLIQSEYSPGLNINYNQTEGLRVVFREPDETELRSFLLTFRQFISDKEPVFLNRIYNLCQQHLTSDLLKGHLVDAREAWKQMQKQSGMKLVVDGQELMPERVTRMWINGYYFHTDSEDFRTLQRLQPHTRPLLRYQFLTFVGEATQNVLYVGHIINIALHEGLVAAPA
jgi:hypothetical protein